MAEEIPQGADREIEITVTNKATGAVVDLTTLAGYIAIIHYADNVVLQQYSRETAAGFKSLTETDAVNGIFTVRLQSADTKTARLEKIFCEVKTEIADGTYDDSTKHDPIILIFVATIVESQSEQYADLT